MFVALIVACEDSLGTDPDYKTTIIERDTIVRIDTLVQIDTVKSSDSTKYIFTIDSLIVVRDSLGNVIDSLSQIIKSIDTRTIAPRFSPILDSIITIVTYKTFDTLYNSRQEEVIINLEKYAFFQPQQSKNNFNLEMDTNLSKNWAWIDFTIDGMFDQMDSTDSQMVFLSDANTKMDSVQTFNTYILYERQGNESISYTSSILDYNGINITQQTNHKVKVNFLNYTFDSEDRINGFDINIEFDLEARNVPFVNRQTNYKFILTYRYP
ncbi:MAG: hypothetical protein CVV25_01530 [Ignavibacteriae bacterium HGW-Ignavibacteriae-4]|jgi:hypothetical protein|nr:MAG: hypothetical protein CVV25_01530 [Ignavibacteriae bacterium HGW-Ignavibacteriae-4]